MANASSSRLGSLFGSSGAPAENNDSLRYVAPKEPKKSTASVSSPAASSTSQSSKATPSTSQGNASASASKVVASAAVRLFKLNPSTGGYEAHAGGNPLGCAVIGGGTQYQLLIYNAQKAPQAAVPISRSFNYNLRDLYMSFSDATGNNWSALFDSPDTITSFVKAVVAIVCHVRTHAPSDGNEALGTFKGYLPPSPDFDPSSPVLSAGYTAGGTGIAYKAYEACGHSSDSPSDAFLESPFKQATTSDLAKVKIGGGSDDPIGGLGDALAGHRKGERMFLGIPTGTAYNAGDMSSRRRPAVYVIVEVEIIKIKSDKEKKEKKKEKKSAPEPVVQSASIDEDDGNNRSRSNSISNRMATLAHQSGGSQAGMLAAAMGSRQNMQPQSEQATLQQQQPHVQQPMAQQEQPQYNQQGNSQNIQQGQPQYSQQGHPQNIQQGQPQYSQQGHPQNIQQGQPQYSQQGHPQNIQQGQPQYSQQGQFQQIPQQSMTQQNQPYHQHSQQHNGQFQQTPQHAFQGQYQGQPQHQSQNQPYNQSQQWSPQSQQHQGSSPSQTYAVALVEGQEARSYYLSGDGDSTSSYVRQKQSEQYQQHAQDQNTRKQQEQYDQIHQMMLTLQSSLMGLHGKMDMITASGGAMMGGGMQQLQFLQQQQMQAMLRGGIGGDTMQLQQSGGESIHLKGKQIVDSVQALIAEHDKCSNEVVMLKQQVANASQNRAASASSEDQLSRLQDKVDSLMTRNEKLMNEKSDLWEKHAAALESAAENSSKLSRIQRELESAKRDRDESEDALRAQRDRMSSLRQEIEALKDAAASSSAAKSTSAADRDHIDYLEKSLASITSERDHLSSSIQNLEKIHTNTLADLNAEWSSRMDAVNRESASALKALEQQLTAEFGDKERLWMEERAELKQTISDRQSDIVALEEDLQRARSQAQSNNNTMELQEMQNEIIDLKGQRDAHAQEAERVKKELESLKEENFEKISGNEKYESEIADMRSKIDALQQQHKSEVDSLREQLASQSTGNSSLTQDKVNGIMRDVYAHIQTIFQPSSDSDDEDGEGGNKEHSFSSQDILKRCRKVLKQVASDFANTVDDEVVESV